MRMNTFWLFMATIMVAMTTTGCGPAPKSWPKASPPPDWINEADLLFGEARPHHSQAQIRVIGGGSEVVEQVIRFPAPAPVQAPAQAPNWSWLANAPARGAIRVH